jgi:hypothetical protein
LTGAKAKFSGKLYRTTPAQRGVGAGAGAGPVQGSANGSAAPAAAAGGTAVPSPLDITILLTTSDDSRVAGITAGEEPRVVASGGGP